MSDQPFSEVVVACEAHIAAGDSIFQKFTCSNCGARQVMDTPNLLYTTGRCQECNHITDIAAAGCGYMLISSADPEKHRQFVNELTRDIRSM